MLQYYKNNKQLVHYIICAALIFGLAYVPPFGMLTERGMAMLGVFIGAVYGWSTIGMLYPSMLALVGMGLELGMTTVLAASFGSPTIMMMIVMLIVMQLLNDTGATEIIASKLITNKLTIGKPWMFMTLFLIAVYVCSLLNPIVALMLFLGFLRQVCNSTGIPLRSPFTAVMAIGMTMAALLGQCTLPFYNAGIQYYATITAMFQLQIAYVKWILFFFFVGMLMIIFVVLAARFVLRLDVSKLKNLDPAIFGEKKNFNKDQKISIAAFLLFVAMALLSSLLPPTNPVAAFLNQLTIFGQVVIVAGLLLLLKKEDGTPFFNFNESSARGLSWDVVFLVALIMPLAQFLCAADTGISAMLAMLVYPLQVLPPIVFIIAVLLVGVFLTNFANNLVIAIIIMPLLATFAGQIGMSVAAPIIILIICTQIAFATPAASFPAGICYSFSDIVDASMMMKYGWILVVVLTIMTLVIAYPVAMMIF